MIINNSFFFMFSGKLTVSIKNNFFKPFNFFRIRFLAHIRFLVLLKTLKILK